MFLEFLHINLRGRFVSIEFWFQVLFPSVQGCPSNMEPPAGFHKGKSFFLFDVHYFFSKGGGIGHGRRKMSSKVYHIILI